MPIYHKPKQVLTAFLILITSLNLFQAYGTELLMDESYYWYFSKELHWGYFDHPPMVALLVKLGYLLFRNELGVRLFAPFLLSGTFILLWKSISISNKYDHVLSFILLAGAVGLLNAYGFYMLPDTPLMFFGALFLYSYKRYLDRDDLLAVILLTLSFAGLMYSKYMGILMIFFVLLSNPGLLTQKKFLVAAGISFLIFIPHLIWLFDHDFVSLRYHISERANSFYKLNFTVEYILSLLAIAGLIFPVSYYAVIKYKDGEMFTRSLKFIFWGIAVFFLISSFNRRTQAQWPNLILLPMVILTFNFVTQHKNARKWLHYLSATSIILLLFARIAISNENLSPIMYETHGQRKWTQELKEKIGNIPAIFHNSYRDASMYEFYTGNQAYSLNGLKFRQNQYDLDNSEVSLQHSKVAYLSYYPMPDKSFTLVRPFKNRIWNGKIVDDFSSWRKLELTTHGNKFCLEDTFHLTLFNNYKERIPLNKLDIYALTLNEKKRIIDTLAVSIISPHPQAEIPPLGVINITARIDKPIDSGSPYFRFTISENGLPYGFQGGVLEIKE